MTFKMKYNIEQKLLPKKTKRRSGNTMPIVVFIVAHDTGNDGSTAAGNVNYYTTSANEISASAHTFIDHKQIIECIPATIGAPEKAWHVLYNVPTDNAMFGVDANDTAIGVELCYSDQKGSIDNKEAYKRYVWYIAYLCYKFKIDPNQKIVGHNELDPSRKLDPFKNALKIMGITKDQFIKDIIKEFANCTIQENVYSVYQGNMKLRDFPDYATAFDYAKNIRNVSIRKISDGSWVWSKITTESEDNSPMKLEVWQKSLLISGITNLSKIKGADGSPLINDPDGWLKKIKDETITAGELAIVNFALIVRQVTKG